MQSKPLIAPKSHLPLRTCIVAINAYDSSKGFIRTIQSVIRQNIEAPIKLVVVTNGTKENLIDLKKILRLNPWIPKVDFILGDFESTSDYFRAQTSTDYILFLTASDELIQGSLKRLLSFARKNNAGTVFGASRWTNHIYSWSDPGVDSFFKLPSRLSQAAERYLKSQTNIFMGLYHCESMFDSSESHTHRDGYVLHDYVCRRHIDRPRVRGEKYRTRNRDSLQYGRVRSEPFPEFYNTKNPGADNVWLFGERGGYAAEDNGWALFMHCVDHCQELDCYFIISSDIQLKIPEKYLPKLLIKSSTNWQNKLTAATHILFTDTAADVLESATDTLHYPDIHYIYLTHGYLGYYPGVYQKQHQYIDYVVCTSGYDVEAASDEWGFPSSKFLKSGLPRWDRLARETEPSREILFCPTWRKSFDSSNWNSDGSPTQESIDYFVDSDFYKSIVSLLTARPLHDWLEEGDLHITLNLHFRLRKFLPSFSAICHSRISILNTDRDDRPLSKIMQNACLLITDYSSIMWDMAYMEKTVVCFQHDKPSILGERGKEQYGISDSELPFYVCNTTAECISALNAISRQSFQYTAQQKKSLDRFLPNRDGGNSRRAVEVITQNTARRAFDTNVVCTPARVGLMEIYPARQCINKPSREKEIAIITSDQNARGQNFVHLPRSTWEISLLDDNIKALVIEPSLLATSTWANTFFSIDETRQLLEALIEQSRSNGISVTLSIPPFLTYQKYLADLYTDFDEVIFSDQTKKIEGSYDISIIIPTYNGEQYLARSIDSALNQKFNGKIQVVIIDDGSTDATPDIIDRYITSNANVIAIRQKNSRQGMARNQGIVAASGTYITFLDSDDVLAENAVSELWTIAQRHNTKIAAGIVTSCQEGGNNQKVNQSYYHYSKAPEVINAEHWPHLFYDPSCVGKLYERSFILDNKLFFPQSFHEDQAFCFNLFSTNERIAVTNKVVYFYVARQNDQDVSGTQIFSTEKFRQILLAGTLASETVQYAALSSAVTDYAIGFLLLRYDRFIWKRSSNQSQPADDLEFIDELRGLERIVKSTSDLVIVDNTRYFSLLFLLIKRNDYALAAQVYQGNTDTAVEYFSNEMDFPSELLEKLLDSERFHDAYNYYNAVPLNTPNLNSNLVTEMSYGYRLGSIFVEAAKNPNKALSAPFKLTALSFDMATSRGRKRQEEAKKRLLKHSHQALQHHSTLIKSTAGYQLGVALLEALTHGPKSMFGLPSRIRKIYQKTKPH